MNNKGIEIRDNLLSEEDFKKVYDVIMGDQFPWYWNEGVVEYDDGHNQFTHRFYFDYAPTSEYIEALNPIMKELHALAVIRIKANLIPKADRIVEHGMHVDCTIVNEGQARTAVFYLDDSNGYTIMDDGTKVESIKNRLVTFPTEMFHTGTSCTDLERRVILNFNYIEAPETQIDMTAKDGSRIKI